MHIHKHQKKDTKGKRDNKIRNRGETEGLKEI